MSENINNKKSAVEQLREIRDNISLDIQDMSFEELKKYVEERLTLHPKSAWSNSVTPKPSVR